MDEGSEFGHVMPHAEQGSERCAGPEEEYEGDHECRIVTGIQLEDMKVGEAVGCWPQESRGRCILLARGQSESEEGYKNITWHLGHFLVYSSLSHCCLSDPHIGLGMSKILSYTSYVHG